MAKRVVKKKVEATLFEPAPAPVITKEDMERWHKIIAVANGSIALALARRRRSSSFAQDLVSQLDPVLDELKEIVKWQES